MDEVLPAVVFTLSGCLRVFAGHSFGSPLDLHTNVEESSTSPPAAGLLSLLWLFLESWQPRTIRGTGSLVILVARLSG